ncbi:MAG TPA: acyl-ACP--UDP-N-acetylglucosamine O-acyltransferase [Kiritimatiellia bacterium]|nr:acyl-ACP--UDP-N-acetylglucosamine O-acyltransferase [Kiritimatiellia bacterium]HNS81207.1 acyl-ACP--UDP-N-acetylglucosamine O-acyltransferase [Kiritimatiellia bacterium]HPA77494.1 acyl-ACP--UDP-N-acetylglucosamine O-acyltransferase [Kiritimatiellia bacterium]HQQ03469.1 acyl-ACP--UDP-N-acetylglucosamine O-acyltransferase [Kiritimatiellia bacterium]
MTSIHQTAIVDPGAELGERVSIGPYCVVGADVRIGDDAELMSHVVVGGHTTIGCQCRIFPFASIGQQTQDLKFDGRISYVEIGSRTTIREYVTVNLATSEGDTTRIGSGCLLMAYSHVAHDCQVGDSVIIANCGTLAGHVIVEDQVIVGGLSGIHQFVRIGRLSIIGGCSKVTQDVPPFMMADGHPVSIHGLNSVGLKRRGVSAAARKQLKDAFKLIYRQDLLTTQAVEQIQSWPEKTPELEHLIAFVKSSDRGIVK